MSTRDTWFMTPDERAEPLTFDTLGRNAAGIRIFSARRDLMGVPVFADACGRTDAQLAAAIVEFTVWWVRDVYPCLNAFEGWDCITWEVFR